MSSQSHPWTDICGLADLEPERGVAALVGGLQIAIFRLVDDRVLAVQHLDPVSGANVMARGIVGSRGDNPTVSSPVYKQVYDLISGECLDGQGATPPPLCRFETRVEGGRVLIGGLLGDADAVVVIDPARRYAVEAAVGS